MSHYRSVRLSSNKASSEANIQSWQILCFVSKLKNPLHDSLSQEALYTERHKHNGKKGDAVCDSWQIIFSLVRASRGENSCSQTASGSWCTADPIPEPCRSGSHLPGAREAPCCGTVWTFCGTDPGGAVPWLRRGKKWLRGHVSWHPNCAALHTAVLEEIAMTLEGRGWN